MKRAMKIISVIIWILLRVEGQKTHRETNSRIEQSKKATRNDTLTTQNAFLKAIKPAEQRMNNGFNQTYHNKKIGSTHEPLTGATVFLLAMDLIILCTTVYLVKQTTKIIVLLKGNLRRNRTNYLPLVEESDGNELALRVL